MKSLKKVCEFLVEQGIKYKIVGESDDSFVSFCPLNKLKEDSITWVRDPKNLDVSLLNTIKGIILVAPATTEISGAQFPIIYVEDPHKIYFQIISEFFCDENPDIHEYKIESSAIVETEKVERDVYVGHHTYIGPEVHVGKNVTIHHNVTIQGKVTIGDNTIIESGVSIGVCGYGPYWDDDGNPVLVPHLGDVVIGKHVYIGANTCIARGCLGSTIIEDYVKIDNLVHIAHNVVLKRASMIVANSIICGSAVVEENAWVAPGSVVNEALKVGKNSILGVGTIAIREVPEHKVIVGNPGRILREKIDGEL